MHKRLRVVFLLTLFLAGLVLAPGVRLAAQAPADDTVSTVLPGQVAPRLMNVGNHQHPITTRAARAQLFFNQGLNLSYGFNHYEAFRSFQEAARLDPNCAMAYWGMALVLGPNINMPMPAEDERRAYELVQKAVALKSKASPKEQDYIDALAHRYSAEEKPDRARLDRAYAEAMRRLHEKYPDDLDAATLYAEALMDLRPWNYWARDGHPYPETLEIVRVLESVLARDPDHPGALHFYIHAMEATKNPERAEAAADRLLPLAPAAGHLVHMPSHIYRRIGRYADAVRSNQLAILADEDYITQCRAQGLYPLGYYPHNIHFLWDAATLDGRRALALEAAEKVAAQVDAHVAHEMPLLYGFKVVPLYAYVRFGQWEKILATSAPLADALFWTAIWHYARGMALTATNRLEEAARELTRVEQLAADPKMAETPMFSQNHADGVVRIAAAALAGELAAKRGDFERAIAKLHRAVLYEDALVYTEPPDWPHQMRHSLGAVLLEAGRPLEAEMVYWEDLRRNPENGWSLFGLVQALRAQGKDEEATGIEERFRKAWARADITLTASRFMGPVRAGDAGAPSSRTAGGQRRE